MVITMLLIAAVIFFAIPAIRALFANSIDYTDTGLACLALAMLLPRV